MTRQSGRAGIITAGLAALILNINGCNIQVTQSGPPRVEAQIEYPNGSSSGRADNSRELVRVVQDDAVSGSFFGFDAEQPEDMAEVTEFEADTSRPDQSFAVSVSNSVQTDRVTIDETQVDFDYNADESFDFVVSRGDNVLFSGLDVPRDEIKDSARRLAKITADNVADCTRQLITQVADDILRDLGGAHPEFVNCIVEQVTELTQFTDTICVAQNVLFEALIIEEQECAQTNACVRGRLLPSQESAAFYSAISVVVLERVIAQVRGKADLCPIAGDSQVPTADAGPDQSILGAGNLITLFGEGSTDPNGDPLSFQWVQIDGAPVDVVGDDNINALFNAPSVTDDLVFELTVMDEYGNQDSDTVTVAVSATDAPYAYSGPNQTVAPGAVVQLDGSLSRDAEGAITYDWTQTDGLDVELSNPDTATPTFTAPPGTAFFNFTQLEFQLRVTDEDGHVAADTVVVTVSL